MPNELMTKEEIQNAVGRTALHVSELADAVGILQAEVKSVNKSFLEIKEAESSHYQEFLDYKEVQKDKEYIDQQIRKNLKKRFTTVLAIC